MFVAPIYAADIKLTITGVGDTKANAILDAQRNALRYSYGEFISSDVTVLNNELKKNEIVNLVSGTIKNFKVLSSTDVFYAKEKFIEVLLEVETSQDDIISFSKSIGVDANISGSLFGAQVKLQKINSKNESVAIEHLLKLVKSIDDVFDYKLKVFDPEVFNGAEWASYLKRRAELDDYEGEEDRYSIRIRTPLILNDNYVALRESIINTLKSIDMTWKELQEYRKYKKPAYQIDIMIDREGDCAYKFEGGYNITYQSVRDTANDTRCFKYDFYTKKELRESNYRKRGYSGTYSKNRIWLRSKKSIDLLGQMNSIINQQINKYKLQRISGSEINSVKKLAFGHRIYAEYNEKQGKIVPTTNYKEWRKNPDVIMSSFVSIFDRINSLGPINDPQRYLSSSDSITNFSLNNRDWSDTGTNNCDQSWEFNNRRITYCDNPRHNKIRFYEKGHPFAYLLWDDLVTESELSEITKYSIDIN